MKRFCVNCGEPNTRVEFGQVCFDSYILSWKCSRCQTIYTYRRGLIIGIEPDGGRGNVLYTPQADGTLFIFKDEKL